MWDRSSQYLRKMGGPILIASILIWFLGYFPQDKERDNLFDRDIVQIGVQYDKNEISSDEKKQMTAVIDHARNTSHQENSYIGRIGKFIEPVMRPLGFDWKISVSLLSGMAAKEIVVSTMGVLYTGDSNNQHSLQERLQAETYPGGGHQFSLIS